MDARWNQLPVVDRELGMRLAGNQPDLAKDMLTMLAAGLPNDLATINQSYATHDYPDLLQKVHKLHGAVSYCGVPRLKGVLARIELQLKVNMTDELPDLMRLLNNEAACLLAECRDL